MTLNHVRNLFAVTFAIVALAMFFTFATAAHATPSGVQYQFPCQVSKTVSACVVVDKVVAPQPVAKHIVFDETLAKPFVGQVNSFAVIYRVRAPKGMTNTINFERRLDHATEFMLSDISDNEPTLFWANTRDGGWTWSQMQSNNTDAINGVM